MLDIQRFLGLTGFYRRFIAGYANMAVPRTDLLKNDCPFAWGEQQQSAFQALKQAMTTAPLLRIAHPDLGYTTYINAFRPCNRSCPQPTTAGWQLDAGPLLSHGSYLQQSATTPPTGRSYWQ